MSLARGNCLPNIICQGRPSKANLFKFSAVLIMFTLDNTVLVEFDGET
jgi:hypothetical protein